MPADLLGAEGAEVERDPDRDRRRGVAEVVHEVGEKRDRPRRGEDRRLHESSSAENREADENGADAGARAHDRAIDEAMRVTVLTVVVRVPLVEDRARARPSQAAVLAESAQLDEQARSPAWSTCSVVCSIPNSSSSSCSSSRRRPWQSSPRPNEDVRRQRREARRDRPHVEVVHLDDSRRAARAVDRAAAVSIPRGAASSRIAVESRRIDHALASTSTPMRMLTSGSACDPAGREDHDRSDRDARSSRGGPQRRAGTRPRH